MFNTKNSKDISYIRPALRVEGLTLEKITFNDKEELEFLFVDSKGSIFNPREFKPSREIQGNTLTEEEFQTNVDRITNRIAHIAKGYISEEVVLSFQGDTWEAFCQDVINKLGSAYRSVPTALKIVYKKSKDKYFASLPVFPPFLSTEKRPREFEAKDPKYDIFEIPRSTPDAEDDGAVSKPKLPAEF